MSLAIYKQSPKAYRFLSQIFSLPSKQTLNIHVSHIRFRTGINDMLFLNIKKLVSNLNLYEKTAFITWDEMSLTTFLEYNLFLDEIDGFVDIGPVGKYICQSSAYFYGSWIGQKL